MELRPQLAYGDGGELCFVAVDAKARPRRLLYDVEGHKLVE